MSSLKLQAYKDTVEIVKAAVGARDGSHLGSDALHDTTANYIQSVYDKLCEIVEDANSAPDA